MIDMAISNQQYQWNLFGNGAFVATDFPIAGGENSIFVGAYGTAQNGNLNAVAMVQDTEFVVVEKIGCTPGVSPEGSVSDAGSLTTWIPNMCIQLVIESTGYYRDPQNVYSCGISGMASPYPASIDVIPYYELWPPIYIIPGQVWDVRYTFYNDLHAAFDEGYFTSIPNNVCLGRVYVRYTLFTDSDSLIANKLLSLGLPVSVESVQWFRRLLLESRGLETETFNFYLKASRKYREDEDRKQKMIGLKRYSGLE